MTLEAIYYVSQIVSTVALVVSLIYLGLQTHQTGRNQIAQMHQARSVQLHEYTLRLSDPEFGPLARAAINGDPTLSDDQIFRFYFFANTAFRLFEELHRQWRDGMLGNDRWSTSQKTMEGMLRSPGYRAGYKAIRGVLDPAFVALTDELIMKSKDGAPIDPVEEWRVAAAERLVATQATSK